MKRDKSSISKANSYKEIGDFWDSHDLSDYWDKGKEVEIDIDIKSEITLYAVEKDLSDKLQSIAQKQGVSADTLLNLWLQEKISHNIKMN
ncbi:MAG: hypothetical protein KAW88_03810 [Candidatus Cloacimonetes bacterium]|nr:hypothetical protein [Candidatus Cloacimonadota bacterium]